MHDTDPGRDDSEGLEGLLPPFEELVAFSIADEFHFEIESEGLGTPEVIHLDRMVDDKIDRNEGLDHGGIFPCSGDGITHGREVDQKRYPRKIL